MHSSSLEENNKKLVCSFTDRVCEIPILKVLSLLVNCVDWWNRIEEVAMIQYTMS